MIKKLITFSTRNEYKSFTLKIKLTSNLQLFFWSDEIPLPIRETSRDLSYTIDSNRKLTFNDSDELEQFLDSVVQEYESTFLEETRTKVICYFVENHENHAKTKQGLVVAYRVLEKVQLGDDVFYQEHQKRKWGHSYEERRQVVHHPFHEEFKEMNWTEEREQAFIEISNKLHGINKLLEKILSKKPELLAIQLDNNTITNLLE